jgi:hypothetical protein
MKTLLIVPMLLAAFPSCRTTPKVAVTNQPKTVVWSDDLRFDHDQIVLCPYAQQIQTARCMSPEEYQLRLQVMQMQMEEQQQEQKK